MPDTCFLVVNKHVPEMVIGTLFPTEEEAMTFIEQCQNPDSWEPVEVELDELEYDEA